MHKAHANRLVRARTAAFWIAVLSLVATQVFAADARDIIARVKSSVVAVGTFAPLRNPPFEFRGTGFAVADGSLIATNEHVIPSILDSERNESLAVAVRDGNRIQIRPATRALSDIATDLAVLRIEGARLPALVLGNANGVRDGDSVFFTGFPLGGALGLVPTSHRGMISAITPIALAALSARRLDPKVLRQLSDNPIVVFQLDATAYPGNSGSPLYLPETGEVMGIINMVFVKSSKETAISQPSGISYAIPITYLAELLRRLK
jgi:S1-C subfamily serine protease